MGAMSDFLENKVIDFLFRGQSYVPSPTLYVALFDSAPNDEGQGHELIGGGYARASIAASLAAWAGTQGAASTALSSGSSGTTSNNVNIVFPLPTTAWGTVTHFAVFDAATDGNMLFYGALGASKIINGGDDAPLFPIGSLVYSLDD